LIPGSGKLGEKADLAQFERLQAVFVGTMLQWTETRRLTFCTHACSHECFFLHGQENGYYCVVATGQMLLDFWRYNFTQAQIAAAMARPTWR
jgi:hypothetical protein